MGSSTRSISRSVFLVALVTCELLGFCMSSPCMSGFRPYTCMSCIQFTNEEHAFADSLCDSSSLLLQTEDVQNDILRRYMEVYKNPLYWTGYELKNRRATVPKSNITLEMSVSESCSGNNCCVAWQFKPFGPIALDCDQMLPAICIMAVKFPMMDVETDSSGSGDSDTISVSVNEEMQTFADSHNVTFGANLTLLCTHEQGTDVKWYFDTKQLYKEVVNSNFESRLSLIFSQSGVYRCELTTNGVSSGVRRVTLCGVDGNPGDIQSLTATPYSQTELQVTWTPPPILGTSDPLLLRYTLYYTLDSFVNEHSEIKRVTPQLQDDIVTVQLSNLTKGQKYVLAVVATSVFSTASHFPQLNVLATTYGDAPTESVSGLMAERLKDDVIVSWERADLTLPEGPVSLYLVEYRDAQQTSSNIVHVKPESSFVVLRDVSNANDYEVRVAILVEVDRLPLKYNSSQWTEWVRVNGTTSKSEIKPTSSSGEIKPPESKGRAADIDTVVTAVVVPLAVIIILAFLVSATLCWGCRAKKESSYIERQGKVSILPGVSEEKTLSSTDV